MENGTLDDPVDYLCDITAARAEAMGLPDRPPGWQPGRRRLETTNAVADRAEDRLLNIRGLAAGADSGAGGCVDHACGGCR